jgi:hypothetical protein
MPSPTTAASVKFGASTTVVDVASATASLSRNQIDITAVGDAHRHTAQGFLQGTVQIEVFYESGSTNAGILSNLSTGSKISDVEVIWASGKSIKGDAYVQDASITVAPNDIARCTATLLFSDNAITVVA